MLPAKFVSADEWHYGFELSYFDPNIEQTDDPDNMGLLLSYSWDIEYGSVGIEGGLSRTFEEGSVASQDINIDNTSIYAVYRTRSMNLNSVGPYFKTKIGSSFTDLTVGNINESDTNISAGLGIGVNMMTVAFELEYTKINNNIDMINMLILF